MFKFGGVWAGFLQVRGGIWDFWQYQKGPLSKKEGRFDRLLPVERKGSS